MAPFSFALVRAKAGVFPALIARRCDLTPSRVGEVIKGQREIRDIAVIERVAEGLRVPGHLLGLTPRDWETSREGAAGPRRPVPEAMEPSPWLSVSDGDDLGNPEFVAALVKEQLPRLYSGANFFGPAHAIPSALLQAQTVMGPLETATGITRDTLLRTGSRLSEFLGWLYQDVGDFGHSAYWSDRAMEWAQEAADHPMQSYLLCREAPRPRPKPVPRRPWGWPEPRSALSESLPASPPLRRNRRRGGTRSWAI